MERDAWIRLLLILLVAIAGLYLAGLLWQLATRFADVILLFFLAWLIAFMLRPLARFLTQRCHFPLLLAVALVYLGLALALSTLGFVILPATTSQLLELGRVIPGYVEETPELLARVQDWLGARGIQTELTSTTIAESIIDRAESIGTALAQSALGLAQGVATLVFGAVIVLILSFYIMLYGDRISRGLVAAFPENRHQDVIFLFDCVERAFRGFTRGAVIVGIIYGIGNSLIMWLAGLGFIAPVSTFAGLMMLIPFIGGFLAMIPPVIIALLTGSLLTAIVVFVILFALQQIALNVIGPRVMSQTVGMHPLLVLLAIFLGIKIAGFWGALFGVPVMGIIVSLTIFFYQKTKVGQNQPNNNLA